MTEDREPRRYRPGLEGLEVRDLPSALATQGAQRARIMRRPPISTSSWRAKPGGPTTPAVQASRGLIPAQPRPRGSTKAFCNRLPASSMHRSRRPRRSGYRPDFPAGDLFGPAADQRGGPPRDLLGRVRRPLLGGTAAVLQPGGHDPHLQRRQVVTSNQFLNGRAQVLLFPPADPTAKPTTDDPVAGQVAGLMISVFREHPAVGERALRRGD